MTEYFIEKIVDNSYILHQGLSKEGDCIGKYETLGLLLSRVNIGDNVDHTGVSLEEFQQIAKKRGVIPNIPCL